MQHFLPRLACLVLLVSILQCHKSPPPKTNKEKREESVQKQAQDRAALDDFANSARTVFEWRQGRPPAADPASHAAEIRALSDKLHEVKADGLPPDLAKAWKEVLAHWSKLSKEMSGTPSQADLQQLRQQGQESERKLNRLLNEQGIADLHF